MLKPKPRPLLSHMRNTALEFNLSPWRRRLSVKRRGFYECLTEIPAGDSQSPSLTAPSLLPVSKASPASSASIARGTVTPTRAPPRARLGNRSRRGRLSREMPLGTRLRRFLKVACSFKGRLPSNQKDMVLFPVSANSKSIDIGE